MLPPWPLPALADISSCQDREVWRALSPAGARHSARGFPITPGHTSVVRCISRRLACGIASGGVGGLHVCIFSKGTLVCSVVGESPVLDAVDFIFAAPHLRPPCRVDIVCGATGTQTGNPLCLLGPRTSHAGLTTNNHQAPANCRRLTIKRRGVLPQLSGQRHEL